MLHITLVDDCKRNGGLSFTQAVLLDFKRATRNKPSEVLAAKSEKRDCVQIAEMATSVVTGCSVMEVYVLRDFICAVSSVVIYVICHVLLGKASLVSFPSGT